MAFGQSIAKALAPEGIGVTTLAPGFVDTEMAAELLDGPTGDDIRNQSPFGRVAQPDELARAVYFLASRDGKYYFYANGKPGLDDETGECIINFYSFVEEK